MILAGHGRVAAAPLVGLTEVPCVRLEEMTPSQKRAYVLADNKLALNAGWDENILANELQTLLSIDAEFDLDAIGFTIAEADCLIEGLTPEEAGDPADDRMPELAKGKPITVLGDLWQLGDGRLVCGSALEDQPYQLLLAGEKAQMVFTDPPYNVPITGHAGNSGKTLVWGVLGTLATALGAYVVVFSNPGFGLMVDFLFCLFWGFGLPIGAQQLAQASIANVGSALGVPVLKSG